MKVILLRGSYDHYNVNKQSEPASYTINFEDIKEWIRSHGFRRVLIQAPAGLRKMALKLSNELSDLVDFIAIHGGSCWGGCDVAFKHAELVGADAIIHLGHSKFLQRDLIPTYYLECRYRDSLQLFKSLDEASQALKEFEKIGFGTIVQWQDFLNEVKEKLVCMGFEVFSGPPDPPLRYEGQILGCSYNTLFKVSDRVDCFLVVGSKFHGIGLALQTERDVFVIDPEAGRIEDLSMEVGKLLKNRYAYIEKFRGSGRVGVIVSVKPGQCRLELAASLKEMLRGSGKDAEILLMDDVLPEQLMDLPFEAFVNTACPRISVEDQYRMSKPILLPAETLISIGELKWDEVIKTPKYMSMEVV